MAQDLDKILSIGQTALDSGRVTPQEVENAKTLLQQPGAQDFISQLLAPKPAAIEKSNLKTDKTKQLKQNSEASSERKQTRNIMAGGDEFGDYADIIRNLPEVQAQQEGIGQLEGMLDMTRKAKGSGGDWMVAPLLSLADAQTGSNLSANYKPSETKNEKLLKYADDIQKRKSDMSKTVLEGITKLKMGSDMNGQKQNVTNVYTQGGNMGGAAGNRTPKSIYQDSVDRAFGKTAADFVAGGGYATVQKNLKQLKEVILQLKSGDDQISGSFVGMVPQGLRSSIPGLRASANAQARISGIISQSLKQTLGAQFTEGEGVRLLKTAYDPNATEEENASRLQDAYDQMAEDAEAILQNAEYADEVGTVKGAPGMRRKISQNQGGEDLVAPPAGKNPGAKPKSRLEELRAKKAGV